MLVPALAQDAQLLQRVRASPRRRRGSSPAAGSPACGWRSPAGSGRSSPRISGRAIPDTSAPPATASASRGSSPPPATAAPGRRHPARPAAAASRTVLCLTGCTGSAAKGRWSARSNSTAWRKLTPSARITQSITVPPALHAPRQCHRFFSGVITSDGLRSSWNGHSPIRSAPWRVQLDPPRLGQPLHRDFPLQPLDLRLRDSRHLCSFRRLFSEKPCQEGYDLFFCTLSV